MNKKIITIMLLATTLVACNEKKEEKVVTDRIGQNLEEVDSTTSADAPTNTDITLDFKIKEINEESVTLAEIGNEESLYTYPIKDLPNENPNIGDKYRITWDGVILESYPAQFGKIKDIEHLEN